VFYNHISALALATQWHGAYLGILVREALVYFLGNGCHSGNKSIGNKWGKFQEILISKLEAKYTWAILITTL